MAFGGVANGSIKANDPISVTHQMAMIIATASVWIMAGLLALSSTNSTRHMAISGARMN